jgi:hypothetical protein
MGNEIRSARDIVLEKIASLDAITSGERLKWKYTPEGEQLAIRYFKDGLDLASAISTYPAEAQPFIKNGAEKVVLDNIQLPINDVVSARNNRAMDVVLRLKSDKVSTTKVLDQLKYILTHYFDQGASQRKEARDMLKQQFEAKLKQAVKKQIGSNAESADLGVNVETLPQFQEELRRTIAQMDNQYLTLLDEYKQGLRDIK